MRLVRGQAQHDEVRIGAVKAVPGGGVVVGLTALMSDELHDLVLTFASFLKSFKGNRTLEA